MKPIVIVGVICIVLGLAALAYQGITYTTREKVVDVGPVQVTAEKEHAIWLPPLLGVWRWEPVSCSSSWDRGGHRAAVASPQEGS